MEEIGAVLAEIYKIQSLADGGARITLNIGADNAKIIAKLLEYKMMSNGLVAIGITKAED